MKLKLLILLSFSQLYIATAQQQLSSNAEISVVTFGPGNNLNDAFGHCVFRIYDKANAIDIAYGYGEYDFDAPNFYLKFVQGKLNYRVSKNQFSDLLTYYINENRYVKAQILNFNIEEKQRIFNYLENNYKPENRSYLYDFFYNNCATKIRDIAQHVTNNEINFNTSEDFKPTTFRALIHEHVGLNSWGGFGIDIALGSYVDLKATPKDYLFLPKYVNSTFKIAKLNNKPLVASNTELFKATNNEVRFFELLWSPLVIISLIAFFIVYKTCKDFKNNRQTKWLDITIFVTTGLIGIILLLLWFATDHTATAYNYNLLWAFPLNFIVIVEVLKKQKKKWYKSYLKFLVIMLCLMGLHWCIGLQSFALVLLPLLISIAVRLIFLIKVSSNNCNG